MDNDLQEWNNEADEARRIFKPGAQGKQGYEEIRAMFTPCVTRALPRARASFVFTNSAPRWCW